MLAGIAPERLRALDESLGWVPERHQMAPPGDWTYWLFVAGRGSGKTDSGAHYVTQHVRGPACLDGPVPHRVGIAAPTLGDARHTCVKGDSGLLAHDRTARFVLMDGEVVWANGSLGRIFGAYTPEDVERWRGPQHCLVWADELAAWRYLGECWDMMRLGLRLGEHPRAIVTTTGKPRKELKALMSRPDAVVTRATTNDNPHLAQGVRDALYDLYRGTRLERQELGGDIVEDVEGALWSRDLIDRTPAPRAHVNGELVPAMRRIVVAIDPAVTSRADSDETGIIVAGLGEDGYVYILEDASIRSTPHGWASAAVRVYHKWRADRIVAETNNGGEMVRLTLGTVDETVPIREVHASQGKRTRAEPVVAKYEQKRVRHPEPLPGLEEQMLSWDPARDADSPDRVDALVWAVTDLVLGNPWSGNANMSGVA